MNNLGERLTRQIQPLPIALHKIEKCDNERPHYMIHSGPPDRSQGGRERLVSKPLEIHPVAQIRKVLVTAASDIEPLIPS
jgi:hypothetical protein